MKHLFLIFMTICTLFSKEISVATYNVENLFDDKNNGNEYKDFIIPQGKWTANLAGVKFNQTLKAIKAIDADIISLQEVENEELLKLLAKKSSYKYFAFAKPYRSPVGLGILSRYPIKKQKSIYAGIERTRDFLYTQIEIENELVAFYSVHFPTLRFSPYEREKVAKTLKKAVLKANDKKVVLLGDFNTKISHDSILQKSFGSLWNKKGFYDPWGEIEPQKRYSQVYNNQKSALDRIILSENLLKGDGLILKERSFGVVKGFLSDKEGYPKRFIRKAPYGYSDHFPLKIILSDDKKPQSPSTTTIKDLHKQNGSLNVEVKNAVLIYQDKQGVIFSDKTKNIYAFKPIMELKLGHKYDILVKNVKEYKSVKEIALFEILNDFGKVDMEKYFLKDLKNAQINDVINDVKGVYKDGFLHIKNSRIKLKKSKKFKQNQTLKFKNARIGFDGKNLVLIGN